jgi:hypothetical protein
MRIIGSIEHPQLKISVFKNDNRLSVKLEDSLYELWYKFGDDDRFRTVEDVQRFADAAFIQQVLLQLQSMHHNRLATLNRNFAAPDEAEFENII